MQPQPAPAATPPRPEPLAQLCASQKPLDRCPRHPSRGLDFAGVRPLAAYLLVLRRLLTTAWRSLCRRWHETTSNGTANCRKTPWYANLSASARGFSSSGLEDVASHATVILQTHRRGCNTNNSRTGCVSNTCRGPPVWRQPGFQGLPNPGVCSARAAPRHFGRARGLIRT